MSVFVHAQAKKTFHAGGGGQKSQNSVHVVVGCPRPMNVYLVHVLADSE